MIFKQFLLLSACIAFLAVAAPITVKDRFIEMQSSGMSDNGVQALWDLVNKFKVEYPKHSRSKETTDKFMADFTVIAQNVVSSMSKEDQMVYRDYVKRHGLS
ncbi:hypothetical protein GCK72_020275 [Caenorhabditis remanei]|uniref:SXP/RAL-2 family protein Ani s 5-like cation-binding domain-containing protein n=1 Tax=Caenorhabditis remanei TaxID=31234 RepID=A0A6A5GEV2_CAERE|nr:hypothetical protein GCK72_020275 [Caenorhabditis remanei]KAF1753718.1 hypothetical protein GCK72_020275 [Caenorhabditis remanei]